MLAQIFRSFFLALSLILGVCANSHVLHNRYHEIAKRHATDVQLHKRFASRWTFYDVGLGACGKWNGPSDFIVALNAAQFGGGYPGPNCFKTITMVFNGISAQAQIVDECMACPWGGLDLSRGLFSHFSSLGAGVVYGTWTFDDGSGGGGNFAPSSSPPPPRTTSTTWQQPWTQTPTSTWQPSSTPPAKPKPSSTTSTTTSTTTTSEKPSTTTSHNTTSSSSTSVDYTSNGLAVPTGTLSPNSPQNLNNINSLLIQYGALIVAAGSAY